MRSSVRGSVSPWMVLLCSSLLVWQPCYAAQGHPTAKAVHPARSARSELVAVANVTGRAERNGRPLENGGIVSSGDVLRTDGNSALLLAPAPAERVWFGPHTSAIVRKDSGSWAVALERGTVGFETRGRMRVSLEEQGGLALRSRGDSLVVAQLSSTDGQLARVRLRRGSLELLEGSHSIPFGAGQPARLSWTAARFTAGPADRTDPGSQAVPESQSEKGSVTGTVVNSQAFVVSGASVTLSNAAGSSFITITNAQGAFDIKNVPPGTYVLQVVSAGAPKYEMPDVVVSAGKASAVYVQLGEGGHKSHGLIIALVAGGGAAAGIGAWAATKKGTPSPSNSPSVP